MTSAQLQKRIDSGNGGLPALGQLDTPLFLYEGDIYPGTPGAEPVLSCDNAGTAFVLGYPRGMVGDEYYTPSGFRTHGVAAIYGHGTEFDLGPIGRGETGWRDQSQFTLHFRATIHDGTWNSDWAYLCGIQSQLAGPWDTQPDQPSPFLLFWAPGDPHVTLSTRTNDGVRRRFFVPATASVATLDLSVTVDLNTAAITATVGGSPVTPTTETTDWPTGLKFADNTHFPLFVGSVYSPVSTGWWGGLVRDMTIHRCRLEWGDRAAEVMVTSPRPQTYEDGPSLPLIPAWASYGCRYLLVAHKDQETAVGGPITLRDFTIRVCWGSPAIVINNIQDGVVLDRVHIDQASRAMQTTGLVVAYPILIRDCNLTHFTDRALWLRTVASLTIEGQTKIKYFERAIGALWNCNSTVRDLFVAPAPIPGGVQDYGFEVWGGYFGAENAIVNYEWDPAPVVATVIPYAPWWDFAVPCEVDLNRCIGRTNHPQVWSVEPTRTFDDATATIRVNGGTVWPSNQ